MIEQIPDEIIPYAEEALRYTGRELTVRIGRIRQMIRERTRRLNQEASGAAGELQTELHSGMGERDVGTQTGTVARS